MKLIAQDYATPFPVLLAEVFAGRARSTAETRLNQLAHEDLIGKATAPVLYFYLRPKGAEIVENEGGTPPPDQYLQGEFGMKAIADHLAISTFRSRYKHRIIRQRDAHKLGHWCEHKVPNRSYFQENGIVYLIVVNGSMRSRDVIKKCAKEVRARKTIHGDEFINCLKARKFQWCILVPGLRKGQAILDVALKLEFPAPGKNPEDWFRIVAIPEIRKFLPKTENRDVSSVST